MKFIAFFAIFLGAIITITCTTTKHLEPSRARQLKPSEVTAYHVPLEMKIAWFPYKELELKKSKANNWVMVSSDSSKQSSIPVIMITYPESNDSIWIDMNIKNELLGKLVKHSLMTQLPITEPFGDYFAKTSCTTCHPSNVKVNFNW